MARSKLPSPRVVVAAFAILWIAAMGAYPGWNNFQPESQGHDFLRNFLCDLLSARTPDGRPNVAGAAMMNAAILALTLGGLLPLWWRAAAKPRWRVTARILGVVSAAMTTAICVEQALGLSWSHNVITLGAGAAGLVPTAMAAAKDWRTPGKRILRRTFMALGIAGSLANFTSYALVQLGSPLTPWVPISQKLALLGLLGWLATEPFPAGQSAAPNNLHQGRPRVSL